MELKISSNFMEITSSDLSNTNGGGKAAAQFILIVGGAAFLVIGAPVACAIAGGIAIVGGIITVVAGIAWLLYEQVWFCF